MPLPIYEPLKKIRVNSGGQIYLGKSWENAKFHIFIDNFQITTASYPDGVFVVTSGRLSVGRPYINQVAWIYPLRDDVDSETPK